MSNIERVLPRIPRIVTSNPALVARGIERSAEIVSRFWAEALIDNLTAPAPEGTPRKSGFAAASWIVSVGSPTTEVGGSKGNADWGPQKASVEALEGWTLDQGAIFIVNNAPHIVRLNYGWSAQSPAGFVESAFGRTYNEVNRVFRDL